jgi:hypothetical protein
MEAIIRKLKTLCLYFFNRDIQYEDVNYHTGFYRFSEYISQDTSFKVNGIPCLQQRGMKEFVFYTQTDMTGTLGIVPVKMII